MRIFKSRRKHSADGHFDPPTPDHKGFIRWPRRVIPRPIKSVHRNAAKLALEAFSADRAPCPDCERAGRSGVLMPVPGRLNTRRCSVPECAFEITLRELADINSPVLNYSPQARIAHFDRSALTLFVVGCLVLSAAVFYSGWLGSGIMMIAAFILVMPLFMGAFAMRYRAWQVREDRFYEDRAPIGDFVNSEIAGLFRSQAR